MKTDRRKFIEGLLGIYAIHFSLSFAKTKVSETYTSAKTKIKNTLELSGLWYLLQTPCSKVGHRLKSGSALDLQTELIEKYQELGISSVKFSDHLLKKATHHLETSLQESMSADDLNNINAFFSTEVGAKYAECLKEIPYGSKIDAMVAEHWRLLEGSSLV